MPEVLHETSDSFQGFFRSPTGDTYLYGKKLHFMVKGKWKSKEITARAQRIVRVGAFGGRVFVALGWSEAFGEWVDGELGKIDLGLTGLCEDIVGTGPDDVYVSTGDGLAYFDGTHWKILGGAPERARLACVSRDEVYTTGIDSEEGRIFALYRGNARAGFSGLVHMETVAVDGGFDKIVPALGGIYLVASGGADRGLYQLRGAEIVRIMTATGYTGRAAGNASVLWVDNGIELLCFDGAHWKTVPRVYHDTTKG